MGKNKSKVVQNKGRAQLQSQITSSRTLCLYSLVIVLVLLAATLWLPAWVYKTADDGGEVIIIALSYLTCGTDIVHHTDKGNSAAVYTGVIGLAVPLLLCPPGPPTLGSDVPWTSYPRVGCPPLG